jgi:hypothetical protein
VAESKCVLVGVAAGKALVGHVEEGEVITLLDRSGDVSPLLLGRVDTSRVVGTGMEQDNAALRHSLDVGDHSVKVKTNGLLVVVSVLLDL